MPRMTGSSADLWALQHQTAPAFFVKTMKLGLAIAEGDMAKHRKAMLSLQSTYGDVMILADLLGRARMFGEFDAAPSVGRSAMAEAEGVVLFRAPRSSATEQLPFGGEDVLRVVGTERVPKVLFKEALKEILSREPRLVPHFRDIQQLYRQHRAFAAARATDVAMTKRIHKVFSAMLQIGAPEAKAVDAIEQVSGWARGYSQTVYRTNLATAHSYGRFRQARDPVVSRVVKAFRLVTIRDDDVRPNHRAAHGLTASPADTVWNDFTPPLGYNCRCTLRTVTKYELRRRGLIADNIILRWEPPTFRGAHPDDGFGDRASFLRREFR